jgi:hypothetical protein
VIKEEIQDLLCFTWNQLRFILATLIVFGLVKIRLELFEQLESEWIIDFIFRKEIIRERRIEQRFVLEIKSFDLRMNG